MESRRRALRTALAWRPGPGAACCPGRLGRRRPGSSRRRNDRGRACCTPGVVPPADPPEQPTALHPLGSESPLPPARSLREVRGDGVDADARVAYDWLVRRHVLILGAAGGLEFGYA